MSFPHEGERLAMPYGFNEDKSMFDLGGMADRIVSFVPSAGQTKVVLNDAQCVVHGTTGLLTGTASFRDVDAGAWYMLGALSGLSLVAQAGMRAAVMHDLTINITADVRIDIDGKVYFKPHTYANSTNRTATCSFNIMFRVAPA